THKRYHVNTRIAGRLNGPAEPTVHRRRTNYSRRWAKKHGVNMKNERNFYIDGKWVTPHSTQTLDVLNPANEEVIGTITLGDQEDVNRAVAAAKKAFQTFSKTTVAERAALLERIIATYQTRMPDLASTISREMGAPLSLANAAQAPAGLGHLTQ